MTNRAVSGAYNENAVYLDQHLIVNYEFLVHFQRDNILTPNMVADIEALPMPSDKRSRFLGIIRKRGLAGFQRLIEALDATGQTHIADKLDPQRRLSQSSGSGVDSVDNTLQPSGACPRKLEDTGDPTINIDILEADKDAAQSRIGHQECYPFVSRGRAVVVSNIESGPDLSNKIGPFDDVNICELFGRLGFDTVMHSQLTAQELIENAEKERENDIHKTADAFAFILFCRGDRKLVFGSDGKPVEFEKLLEIFDGKQFPCMIGKPKIFIIQAFQDGVLEANSSDDAKKVRRDCLESNASASSQSQGAAVRHDAGEVHEKADFIWAKCVVPSDKCYSKENEGTRFIRALIYTFMERCHCEHLGEMFTEVTRKCAMSGIQIEQSGTSTKKVYFLPGYHA